MEKNYKMDVEQMTALLDRHDFKQLKEELESMHPVDIVDAFEELDKKQRDSGVPAAGKGRSGGSLYGYEQ